MNKSTQKLIISVLAFICFAAYQYFTTGEIPLLNGNKGSNKPNSSVYANDSEILAGLQDKKMIFTKHAKCRMDCRTISEKEVRTVLGNGRVNHRKSEQQGDNCPTYAVEGNTKDGQKVRIVFADCNDVTKVVTTIDLGKKYNCYCK